ncbi:MAG: ThuA domain-containing protein [Opitutales bacterium]
MKYTKCICFFAFLAILATGAQAKIKVLIIDGQNNHVVWPRSTIMMKQYLEESGLFEVDIDRTRFTWRGTKRDGDWLPKAGIEGTVDLPNPKHDPDFMPSFDGYDVVVSNFGVKAAHWPDATREAFDVFVGNGGGFVSVHAADNSFADWPEYNEMIGIGGWGGRKGNMPGAYVYYDDAGNLVRDEAPGKKVGGHGHRHEFPITVRQPDHPIMQGLPPVWITSQDECYANLRGPAKNLTVLATGKDVSEKAASDKHEPMLMVIDYGNGRVFHTTLGHDFQAFEGVGFITTFLRGTEWAATGKVTQPVPADFPTATEAKSRPFEYKQ